MRTVLLSALLAASTPVAAAPTRLVLDDVAWRVSHDGRAAPRLTLSRGGTMGSGFDLDERTVELRTLRDASDRGVEGPVAFSLDRQAGSLRCEGTLRARAGFGRCRFVSRPAFEQGLATRSMPLKRRMQLFDLMLVNARLERADGLARGGIPLRNANDLITASALDVDGDYAQSLKAAGLSVRSFNDLVACRALGVDADWVRGLASAGYRGADARRAIEMKAVGVTPDYARAMNGAAARASAGTPR